MAVGREKIEQSRDAFRHIAPYYDTIMDHVTYHRWDFVARALSDLLPENFVHVDVACGTGTLLKRLRKVAWNGVGVDISYSMVREGRRCSSPPPVTVADMRALPFFENVHFVTCLFDSLNFILELDELKKTMKEISASLTEGGLFFFDAVTERMVTEHFAGQEWTEDADDFTTTWSSVYDRSTSVAETLVTTSTDASVVIRERVYTRDEIETALKKAGLRVLGVFDAKTWKRPTKKTVRMDYVAVKGSPRRFRRSFKAVQTLVRGAS